MARIENHTFDELHTGDSASLILTSRADKTLARMGSCAIAMLVVGHRAAVAA